jgi:hypothetical protein
MSTNASLSFETASNIPGWFGAVLVLFLSVWVIHRKNRSLWWLLMLGWLSPIWLANKNPNALNQSMKKLS